MARCAHSGGALRQWITRGPRDKSLTHIYFTEANEFCVKIMFSPFKDHFNMGLSSHDVATSKEILNLGGLFVILMVR